MTQTFNMDCYDYMKALPDNAFDLLIADPPYGDCDGSWGRGNASIRGLQGEVCKIQERQRFGARFDRYRDQAGNPGGGGGLFQPYRKGSRAAHGLEDTTDVG